MDRMIAAVLFLSAGPAVAAERLSVPEPSNLALFALGVAGVLIGRFGLGRRKRGPNDPGDKN